eukprot:c7070_g1_i2.p1 GENE.c7070_g1_i2~~c7070_g1_i2.p1  ORF type:complete len:240 (+),score=32.47 c7070_g1_i2:84-803(+)
MSVPQDVDQVIKVFDQTPKIDLVATQILSKFTNKFCVTIDNVLTSDECAAIIELCESRGFEEALLNVGRGRQVLAKDVRDSARCIVDAPELAEMIFQRVSPFIPKQFSNQHVVGLNERLRILRYDQSQVFRPHFDGRYVRAMEAGHERVGEQSFVTVMVYLNEGCEGGQTRFIFDRNTVVDVVPKIGKVLLFQHDMLHEGSEVKGGRKYAMRTDVMYTAKGPGREYSKFPIQLSQPSIL